MKPWASPTVYSAKPWILILAGAVLCVGAMVWSLWAGVWTGWRGLCCCVGAGFAIGGGAILQLRQDYRARSKWRRRDLH
jgi:hypothetical protein